ncbi:MAG TPA: 50S ribosomal protein L21 [Actinomycetota bacterium]
MYAVIKAGGKQQKVKAGEVIEVEFMKTDPGTVIEFEPILIMDDDGHPHVGKALASAKVMGRPLGDKKAKKIKVFKYRPKSGYKRTQGHRQTMTVLEIEEIALSPGKVERKPEQASQPAPAETATTAPAKKAPSKKPVAKKTTAKKTAAKKTTAKKAAGKKATGKKSTGRKP